MRMKSISNDRKYGPPLKTMTMEGKRTNRLICDTVTNFSVAH